MNLCFERDPDVIADMLNGSEGVTPEMINTGVIGLARIVASQGAMIRNLRKDVDSAENAVKELRREIDRMKKQ